MTTATGSPTCRAASDVSGMWGTIARSWTTPGIFFSFRRSQPQGSELTPVMSLPVKTATTPGCRVAAEMSIFRMRAWACGLRTKAAYVMPPSFKSSTYWPRPVMNRGSSRRLIDFPNKRSAATVAMTATSLLRGHVLGRPLDRLDDVVVARAPAQVTLELVPDQLLRWLGVALEHLVDRHDHARRAEPALEPVLLPESLLDRVQLAVLRQPLDRHDIGAVRLDGEEGAGLDGLTVHDDRAGAALARVTADVRAGEAHRLADIVDEEQTGLDFMAVALAVDRHLDWQFHDSSSGIRRFESGPWTPRSGATEGKTSPPGVSTGTGVWAASPAGRGAATNYRSRRRRPSARAWSRTSRTGGEFSRAMRATSANSGGTVKIRPPRRQTLNGRG